MRTLIALLLTVLCASICWGQGDIIVFTGNGLPFQSQRSWTGGRNGWYARRMIMKALLTMLIVTMLAVAAHADSGINFTDWQGTATVSSSGISGNASLICYAGIKSYNGHTLGGVMFQTGMLMSGTVAAGGIYSSAGSLFTITGNGMQRIHKGVIFSGTFTGPIQWTLMGQSGGTSNYALSGQITGMLWSGRTTTGYTTQLISMSGNRARVTSGSNSFGDGKLTTPEPNTLILIGTGISLVGMWHRRLAGGL